MDTPPPWPQRFLASLVPSDRFMSLFFLVMAFVAGLRDSFGFTASGHRDFLWWVRGERQRVRDRVCDAFNTQYNVQMDACTCAADTVKADDSGMTDTMLAGLRGVAGVFAAASAGVWPPCQGGGRPGIAAGGNPQTPQPRTRPPPDLPSPSCTLPSVPSPPPLPSPHLPWPGAGYTGQTAT